MVRQRHSSSTSFLIFLSVSRSYGFSKIPRNPLATEDGDSKRQLALIAQNSDVGVVGRGFVGEVETESPIDPIYYVHVPESGSGFATTIAHHGCGGSLPEDVVVDDPRDFFKSWEDTCSKSRFSRFQSGHDPLASLDDGKLSHAVVMMRNPAQRILSGYYNDLHDCWDLRKKYNCKSTGAFKCDGDVQADDGRFVRKAEAIPPIEYGQCVENCSANMLTGRACSEVGKVDVDRAVDVIEKVGFVGLSDQWELSVCLWHRKFGGRVLPAELSSAGDASKETKKYDTDTLLGKWRPRADARVFEAASERFWNEIDRFGITSELCTQAISGKEELKSKLRSEDSSSFDRASEAEPPPPPQVANINPIYHLQLPEAGAGFATTVAHHGCGSYIPAQAAVSDPREFAQKWELSCSESRFARFSSSNDPLDLVEGSDVSHVVVMLRNPTQRVLSGYYNGLHDCWRLKELHNCNKTGDSPTYHCDGDTKHEDGSFLRNPKVISPVEYGQCVRNCTANMLTGRACSEKGTVDVDRAVRLMNKVGFVGISEEWLLSVCLWHAKFGGRMLPVELNAARRDDVWYDKDLLGNWTADNEETVYAAAARRFWSEIRRLNISRETCEEQAQMVKEEMKESPPGADVEINPIYYLHVPETGSGFATTVAHHGCGGTLSTEVSVVEPEELFKSWESTCDRAHFRRFQSGNNPLDLTEEADLSHVVMMMRDPNQRILSGYYNGLGNCWDLQSRYHCVSSETGESKCEGDDQLSDGRFLRNPRTISPVEYGQCVENCTTNMLTGRSCDSQGLVDVERAVASIPKLGFVGLTHEWSLSVCLWHKRFGGRMLASELANARPGIINSVTGGAGEYDARALLGHWRSDADNKVFEAATDRFWEEIKRFNVSRETCHEEVRALLNPSETATDATNMTIMNATNMSVAEADIIVPYTTSANVTIGDITITNLPVTNATYGSSQQVEDRVAGADFDINPIYYLHVPESGAGFATTVAHHGCYGLSHDVTVSDPDDFLIRSTSTTCSSSQFLRFKSGNDPLVLLQETDLKHVVTMFREPTQRVLSGYYNGLHDCRGFQSRYNCRIWSVTGEYTCEGDTVEAGVLQRNSRAVPPVEYGKCVENCSANILTGRVCDDPGPVDVQRAVRIVDELGFVGLVSEWDLSVCLWHTRFGGRLLPAELENLRPGVVTKETGGYVEYDEHALLGHWRPSADMKVFKAAHARFWQDIERFGVTRQGCKKDAAAAKADPPLPAQPVLDAMIEPMQVEAAPLPVGEDIEISPVYYLHVPESGSGLATTVAHYVCGDELADDLAVLEPSNLTEVSKCDQSRFQRFESGHQPMNVTEDHISNVVVMLREPSQRILSGYFNGLRDCSDLREKYNCEEFENSSKCDGDRQDAAGRFTRDPQHVRPADYGRCVENCTANMLTGRSCGDSGAVNIDRAVALVGRLGFVGLTEEWALSVCLWHKRFGGAMLAAELEHLRPGALRGGMGNYAKYNVHGLLGRWRSTADTLVYEAASRRFWREIERFNVSRDACELEAQLLLETKPRTRVAGVRGAEINPIVYLHVPESGSGLATTVVHHACGSKIPDDVAVLEPNDFLKEYGETCNQTRFARFSSKHEPLRNDTDLAHVVVMIRDPSQRVLSGYFNDLHDCKQLQRRYNCSTISGVFQCDGDVEGTDGRFMRDPSVISPLEYGRCVENCTSNMLTGRSCSDYGDVDVDRAVEIIDNLGFVGLTDEWALSICLWHKMFGGRMLPAELKNIRPGVMATRTRGWGTYDHNALLGPWRPHADTVVLEAAKRRFWTDADRFGIDHASCEREALEIEDTATAVRIVGYGHSEEDASQRETSGDMVDVRSNNLTQLNATATGINPVYYIHVPLSGSGFASTIAHHVCGDDIPEDVWVQEPSEFLLQWGQNCNASRFGRFESGYDSSTLLNPDELAHAVVMIRDPSQRILSGYYTDLHDCEALRQKYCIRLDSTGEYRCEGDTQASDGRFVRSTSSIPPVDYAQCVENCTANMLTGRPCAETGPVDVDLAIDVVGKLGFVGLSDDWVMTVCLWHKKFGGKILPVELMNVRPGVFTTTSNATRYDPDALLGSWHPTADSLVFDSAVNRFWADVSRSGLDRTLCEQEARAIVARSLSNGLPADV